MGHDLSVRDFVLLSDSRQLPELCVMKVIELPSMAAVDSPGFRTVQERCHHSSTVYLDLCLLCDVTLFPHISVQPKEGRVC